MIKKIYILILMLLGLISFSVLGQSSEATMRVSVTVVSGASVDVNSPPIVHLASQGNTDLGVLNFRGINEGDVIVSSSDNILLEDKNGDQVQLKIDRKSSSERGSNQIQFQGYFQDKMKNSVYQGELVASVEYF